MTTLLAVVNHAKIADAPLICRVPVLCCFVSISCHKFESPMAVDNVRMFLSSAHLCALTLMLPVYRTCLFGCHCERKPQLNCATCDFVINRLRNSSTSPGPNRIGRQGGKSQCARSGKKQRKIRRSKGKDSRWRARYGLADFDGTHNAKRFKSSFSSTYCTIVCQKTPGYCATNALSDGAAWFPL